MINKYKLKLFKMDVLVCVSKLSNKLEELKSNRKESCRSESFKSLDDLKECLTSRLQNNNEYFNAYKVGLGVCD